MKDNEIYTVEELFDFAEPITVEEFLETLEENEE